MSMSHYDCSRDSTISSVVQHFMSSELRSLINSISIVLAKIQIFIDVLAATILLPGS